MHNLQQTGGIAGRRIARYAFSLNLVLLLTSLGLAACGSGSTSPAVSIEPSGPSPFISIVHLDGYDPSTLASVQYTIAPKPGSASRPVHVQYSMAALGARGYLSNGSLAVPVFGLYAGYANQVLMTLTTVDGAQIPLAITIPTEYYVDPTGIYTKPTIVMPRAAGSQLGFDFIYVRSGLGSPVIIDTDGEIRWVAPGVSNSISSTLVGDTFVIGDPTQPTVYRLRLDGNLTSGPLPPSGYIDFNHDIERGKIGLLAEVDAAANGTENFESNVIELRDPSSDSIVIPHRWDLGAILTAYMTSQGDDAAAFVRPGVDWFHSNSAIYDPSDDSVIVSSRENFVIKLDYRTGAIKWILGDPTKYWYTFPSLRAKALTLAPGGLYPVGQHGLSITPDGLLMLFNDGLGSLNEPAGAPPGITRTYSAVSAYSIDPTAMTAQEVWRYDAGQSIFSPFCSSAYETADRSLLVDYAIADDESEALIVGLDSNHEVVFELGYPTSGCATSWNARPMALDDLMIER